MKKLLSIVLIIFMGLSGVAFGQSGFDLYSDKVPKGFKGDDIVRVVEALSKYVTTESPRGGPGKRIDLSDKNDVDRVYVFKLFDDKVLSSPAGVWVEKMTADSWVVRAVRKPEDHYLIRDMGKKRSSYTGQNVFGAKTRVDATTEKRYFVAPINDTGNIGKLSVKPKDGKVGVLFICKPARHSQDEGYIAYFGKGYAATWDAPWSLRQNFESLRVELQEVWVYDQDSGKVLLKQKVPDIPTGKKIDYSSKIDELHSKMKREFDLLAQSDPKNAVAASVGGISNVKKLITERDNLKVEAIKYYHMKLPPDLAKNFEESERKTDQVKKIMQDMESKY